MSSQTSIFDPNCAFCKIVSNDDGFRVFQDEQTIAFLDHRPLFPGHCLLIPRSHFETIQDLSDSLMPPLFSNVRMLSSAVELGMHAEGTLIAANNRVSQSVPHFHVHVVPRRRKDGLKGFFWPRYPYPDDEAADAVQLSIRQALASLVQPQ